MADEYKPGDVVNGHVLGNDGAWHPISAPPPPPVTAPLPPPPPTSGKHSQPTGGEEEGKSGGALKGCLSIVVLLIILGAIGNACSGDDEGTGDSKPAATPTSAADKAEAKAEAEKKAKAKAQAAAAAKARQAEIDNAAFPSERDLALVFKDPDSHVGEVFQVWGSVMQFDAATGTDAFLAQTANRNTTSYGFFDGENAMFSGSASDFSDLVEDDTFTATVEVVGSMSYDTQIGGNTTVPEFLVHKITLQ